MKSVVERIEELSKKNPNDVTEEEKQWVISTWEDIKIAVAKIINS